MPLSPAQINEHLVKWRPLVTGLAWRFRKRLSPAHDLEDITAIGMVALWRAAETFDESLGFKFATYAKRCVLYRFLLEVKNQNYSNRRIVYHCKQSLDAANEDGSPVFTPRCEHIRDPEAALAQARDEQALMLARGQLPDRLQHVLFQRFERDRSMADIARDLDLSRERVRQLEEKALDKLRLRIGA